MAQHPSGWGGAGSGTLAEEGGGKTEAGQSWRELSSQNLNLQLRVAELEAMLGESAGEAGGGAADSSSRLQQDSRAQMTHTQVRGDKKSLEHEWETVGKLREECASLRNDLELGKIPGEPEERRKAIKRKMTSLQEKVAILEAEALALRQNNREALRRRDDAEGPPQRHRPPRT